MPVLVSLGYVITLYGFARATEYICGVSKFSVLSFLKFSFQILLFLVLFLLLFFLYITFGKLSWDTFNMGLYSMQKQVVSLVVWGLAVHFCPQNPQSLFFYLCSSCGKLSGPHGKNMAGSLYGHEMHRQRIPVASVIHGPACCTAWPWCQIALSSVTVTYLET